MILLGTTGTLVQINLVMLLSLALFACHMYFIVKYIVLIAREENIKAEKYVAYSGYFGVVVMIIQFILSATAFKNDVVELEYTYLGLLAALGAVVVLPFLIIYDIKQQKFIKKLSSDEQKKYNISTKDRLPLVGVISALMIISMALFGLCAEAYIYVMQGLSN